MVAQSFCSNSGNLPYEESQSLGLQARVISHNRRQQQQRLLASNLRRQQVYDEIIQEQQQIPRSAVPSRPTSSEIENAQNILNECQLRQQEMEAAVHPRLNQQPPRSIEPFRPTYQDLQIPYNNLREREQRALQEVNLGPDEIVVQQIIQPEIPLVAIDVVDAANIPVTANNVLQYQSTNNAIWILVVILLSLAILTTNITQINNLIIPHAVWYYDPSFLLILISNFLLIIIATVAIHSCTYNNEAPLPNAVSLVTVFSAFLITIFSIIGAITMMNSSRK